VVDCEIRDLEYQLVVLDNNDEDLHGLEDLLFVINADRTMEEEEDATLRAERVFNLDVLSEVEFKRKFCFHKCDVHDLCDALRLPADMTTRNRAKWSGLGDLCFVFMKLAYTAPMVDLEGVFFRDETFLFIVFNGTLDFLHDNGNRLFVDLT